MKSVLYNRIAVKIAFFVNGFVLANWISRLPGIQTIYHADNGAIGLVLLAGSCGAVCAMPFTGWVIIKNGSRKITIFSLIIYCALMPLIPFMQHIAGLATLLFFMGVVTGMLDVAMNAQAVMVEQQYKKPIMTSFHALFSIGMALGAWCGALFVKLQVTLNYHFEVAACVSLLAVGWAARNLVYDIPDSTVKHEEPLFRLPSMSLLGIGLIAFCCLIGEGAMGDWSVNYLLKVAHAGKAIAPLGLSAFAFAMTIGRIFGDKIRVAFGDKKLIVLGGITAMIGLGVALLLPLPWITIAGFFLVGLGLATIVPIAYSLAGNAKGLPSGVGLAMVTTVGYTGFLFGPPVIGFLADWQTLRIALVFVLVLLLIMTILGIRYKAQDQR